MATSAEGPAASPARPTQGGTGWRVGVSILTVFGLVGFLLLYFAFWSGPFSGYQNIVVVLVSLLAFVAINGATWASLGMRHRNRGLGTEASN